MKVIETHIDVDASPTEVWAVLMDFASYGRWNPMVVAISGDTQVGSRLDVKIALQAGKPMTFRPFVIEYFEGKRLAWLGRVGIRGIFDGLHRFEVEPKGNGSTFVHSEEFRGLLPPLLGGTLRRTHESIIAMNEALTREVARRRATPGGAVHVPSATTSSR